MTVWLPGGSIHSRSPADLRHLSIRCPLNVTKRTLASAAPDLLASHEVNRMDWHPPITVWPLTAGSGINFSDPLAAAKSLRTPGMG
jgi:hypothetical protein